MQAGRGGPGKGAKQANGEHRECSERIAPRVACSRKGLARVRVLLLPVAACAAYHVAVDIAAEGEGPPVMCHVKRPAIGKMRHSRRSVEGDAQLVARRSVEEVRALLRWECVLADALRRVRWVHIARDPLIAIVL